MRELTAEGVCREAAGPLGLRPTDLRARELGGGVSNRVWLVEGQGRRLVLKQALPKLRVQEEWLSDPCRIHREAESLRCLESILPAGSVPRVLFEDPAQYFYAMEAAPGDRTWKDLLLAGDVEEEVARNIARTHAKVMAASWNDEELGRAFGDLAAFDQLRIDPYYRFTARRHPALRNGFENAIARAAGEKHCLVHGDWSPKNMMVHGNAVMAIDFEVIHFGDPAFDTAFLINHLLLKSIYRPEFRERYRGAAVAYWECLANSTPADENWLWAGTLVHLPALLLARVDGKSPAEYLKEMGKKQQVRELAISLIAAPATDMDQVFGRLAV